MIVLVLVVASAILYTGFSFETPSKSSSAAPLVLYVADSYAEEGQTLLQGFSSSTGIPVAPPKAGGSLVLAQQIAQGNPVSVFMPVSKSAVEPQYLRNESSGWAVGFAGDEMTVAYANSTAQDSSIKSIGEDHERASTSNSTRDWYSFFSDLTSGSVRVGIADPNADPAGYRGWLVLEAAGAVYSNSSTYFVQRLRSAGTNVTGASAANLIAPLQAGEIAFLFIYKSAAISHSLSYYQLSDAVNLGNPSKSSFYSEFSYTLKTGVQKGAPIVLYVTVPKGSTDYADSIRFVVFVTQNSPTLLQSYHLTIFSPAKLYNSTAVPDQISQLLKSGSLGQGGPL